MFGSFTGYVYSQGGGTPLERPSPSFIFTTDFPFRLHGYGSYKTVSTVTGGSKTKYTDGKLDCGKTYYYKVRAYKDTSLGRLYGKESKAVKLKAAPAQAVIAKASAGKGTATIKAKKQGGVDGYEFSRSLKKKGGFKKIKSSKSPSMKDSKLNAKKTYYYRVRTYKIVKGKKVYGAYSNVKAVQVKK